MPVNLTSLKADLAAKIAALDSTATPEELLLLAASVNNATNDRIITVETVNDLPDLQTGLDYLFPSGTIFYVKSVNTLVVSSNARWIGFDNRVLRSDVPLYEALAWGQNSYGQLGDGTTTNRSSPVTVIGGITNWAQISAGAKATGHTLAVTASGTAYAWGSNGRAELSNVDGTTSAKSSPVSVIGGITNWKQLSSGRRYSLGITSSGVGFGWGYNGSGQLGNGNTMLQPSPVSVIGGIVWSSIAAGENHALGLSTSGIAYAWGSNNYGRLGDGTATNRSSPVTIVGGITNWSQVSAGQKHSLGVTATGVAYAWGHNGTGQLGDGTLTSRSSPVTVIGGITNWSQVAGGSDHSLAVTSSGIAYAWGFNGGNQLGDGTSISRLSPVTVVGGITNWKQVSAAELHSLGVTTTGIAYAWGYNANGRLGDGTTTTRNSPVTVIGGITSWIQVSAGGYKSTGIKA